MVIWKYPIQFVNGERKATIPQNSHILRADVQDGDLFVWVMMHTAPAKPTEEVVFSIYATGQEVEDTDVAPVYLNTVYMYDGKIVLHIFVTLNGTISANAGACFKCVGGGL